MPERVFNCPDCGVEVKTKYTRTLRCKECAEKKRRETRNNWKGRKRPLTEAEMMRRAARVEMEALQTYDPPENIQKCLNCTRTKCNNCLSLQVSTKGEKDDA
jgi:hypothetical protein